MAGKMARQLDWSRPIWERQDGETKHAYQQFLNYRDSERRRTTDHRNGEFFSATWSWRKRVLEWDKHLARQDDEQLIRYRVQMNERHRTIARLAQGRVAEWLQGLTPERVAKFRPSEVARLLEVATKMERDAGRMEGEADLTIGLSGMVETFTQADTESRLAELMQEVKRRVGSTISGEVVEDDDGADEAADAESDEHVPRAIGGGADAATEPPGQAEGTPEV